MAYVTFHATLDRLAPDGVSDRAHLEMAAAHGNAVAVRRLVGPEFPDALSYLHRWFGELSSVRGCAMSGIAPITYADIDAWSRLTRQTPEPHEVQAIIELDAAFRLALTAKDEPPNATPRADDPREQWPARKTQTPEVRDD